MPLTEEPTATCPICRAPTPPDATECPNCGEVLTASPSASEAADERAKPKAALRERFLLYAGIALLLLGGPGIALGSWLHDVLHISYLNYNSFDVFGPMNRLVLGIGLIVMIVGVVFLILSLRLAHPSDVEDAA